MSIISRMSKLWTKRPSDNDDVSSRTGATHDSGFGIAGDRGHAYDDEYFQSVYGVTGRAQLYATYDEIEEGTPEINSGLDIYADYAVSGGTNEGTNNLRLKSQDGIFDDELSDINKRIRLDDHAWRIVRNMCKNGDAFYENIIGPTGFKQLKVLPKSQMFRKEDDEGNLHGFRQVRRNENNPIDFEPWQVSHFRLIVNDEQMYGRSVLWPLKREAKELMLMRAGLTVTRLSRAHRRLIFRVDVGDKSSTSEVQKEIAIAKARNRRRRTIDPKTGKMSLRSNPLRTEEDIYIPVREGTKNDVSVLKGDDSLRTIEDVIMKRSTIISGLKLSESWLGLTGPNIRNVANHQTINFLKTVRRVQKDFKQTAIVPFQIALMLMGIPWEKIFHASIDIAFPKLSLVEDTMRMEIDKLRAEVAKGVRSLGLMSRRDILVTIFDKTEDEAEKLLNGYSEDPVIVAPNGRPARERKQLSRDEKDRVVNEVFSAAEKDVSIQERIDNIRYLLEEYL